MDKPTLTGVKKRQQIKNANKTMFMWVVIASIAVAICLVLGQFMVRQLLFNNKIIGAKNEAYSTIQDNKDSFVLLKDEVNKLTADQSLNNLRVDESDTSLQVIIDALPTNDDRLALATSMQQKVLSGSGVAIESLSVVDSGAPTIENEQRAASDLGEISFNMVLIGDYNQIRQAVTDMERTIRPLSIQNIQLQGSGAQLRATITATTYYLPAKTIESKRETVSP